MRSHLLISLVLPLSIGAFLSVPAGFAQSTNATITLAQTTAPSAGQAGVTSLTLTGSGYPPGTITPNQVQVTLTPASSGGQTISFAPLSVSTLIGGSRRIVFAIPASVSVSSSTDYFVSVAGQTTAASLFRSGNAASLTIDPPTQIATVLPNNASRGQSLGVTITGLFSTFTQNSTVASFGAGISVGGATPGTAGPVNVLSQTKAVAQIVIDPTATPGPRNVTVQTGAQVASLANAFAINGSAASILSVIPSTGMQGQQHLPVAIAGQNTHFVQGVTTASFGAGITLVSVTVSSATSAVAIVNVDPTALVGSRSVTLTTEGEVATLSGGFAVTANNLPHLVSVAPNTGIPGLQSLDVVVTGQGSHFVQGTTTLNFGSGISVVSIAVVDSTHLSAVIAIDPAASQGPRAVVANTGTESLSLDDGFTVGPPPAVILSVSPNSALQGQTNLNVVIYGKNTHFTNDSVLNVGSEITVDNVTAIDSTHLSAKLSVPATATQSPTLTVTSGNEVAHSQLLALDTSCVCIVGFDSASGALLGTLISGITASGGMTYGPDGHLYIANYSGENIVKYDENTGQFLGVFATATSAVGDALVFGRDGNLYAGVNAFGVLVFNGADGSLLSSLPNPPGNDSLSFTWGLTLGPDDNLYLTHNTNNFPWANAVVDRYDGTTGTFIDTFVPFQSGGGFALANSAFGPDGNFYITDFSDSQGDVAAVPALVRRYNGSTGAPMGPFIAAGSGGMNNAWGIAFENNNNLFLSGTLRFDGTTDATLIRRFDATTGQYLNAFGSGREATFDSLVLPTLRIHRALPVTAIATVSPSSAQQGQQNVKVTITGTHTHFLQGITTATFGAGTTVVSLSVTSATTAAAILNVDLTATQGARDVTLTTGSEVAIGPSLFAINAAASLTTISPSSGPQGLSGPISITGQNTHFAQGVTTLNFGSGTTVSNINVGCPTCLTATLAIDATATAGPRTVTVTTGTEVASLANGFTVIAVTTSPIVTSIVPAGGQQGQTLSVAITGQSTHFARGTTQVNFGAGVTTTAVTVSNATSLSAQITIDPAAALGLRGVTVTTGSETESSPKVFNIQAATPILYSLNPGQGTQGQRNLSIAITGVSTHFQQGTTQATFGAGISVASLTVASATSATAIINIDPAAALGKRTVTLTTGSEAASLANSFTVNSPVPTLYSVNPGGSSQGAKNLNVSLTGLDTHFAQGTTNASFGAGITVVSLAVSSPTAATAVINIDPAAAIGFRTVTLSTGSETVSFADGFQVVQGVAGITEINPSSGTQGSQSLSVAVTAQFTHWVKGSTVANFGAGVTVSSLTIRSATTATALVNIDAAAALGSRTVTFTTGAEIVTAPGGFTVLPGVPALTQVNPNSGSLGTANLTVVITGQRTHFVQGTTAVSFGAGIAVVSTTVNSPTSLTAVIAISASAAVGSRTVTVTTGTESAALSNGFSVTAPPPGLISVSPSAGHQGTQSLLVTVTGQYTHFAQGTTTATLGAGVTVVAITVNSQTALTALLNIDSAAAVGGRLVTITTGTETVTLANGFTVQTATSTPLTVTPNSGIQSQSLTVTITGQGTHFVQGTTLARFGPGVMVGSGIAGNFSPVTVTNATTATARLTILRTAMPAPRTVSVQTGSELISSSNAFAVVGSPTLFSASPSQASQGQTVDVIVNGAYTHFAQGTTQASFGAGISVGGGAPGALGQVTVISATSFSAHLVVSATATLGLRTILAKTGSEQASTSLNFSVLGPITGPSPQVSITSPKEASDITAPTSVTGTVTSPNLDYWTLDYQSAGGTATPITFASGTSATVTGTFDPTLLLNGNAVIHLTAVDTSGQTATATVTVVVTRNLKIGNFTVSFNDLSVPVAGLPIQVIRTYDSRFKETGDFGVGWRLDVSAAQVTENIPLSDEWYGASSGGRFPTYCLQEVKPHKLTVTLNDGTTYEFLPVLSGGGCYPLEPPNLFNITFAPTGTTPANASLAIAGNNQALDTDQPWPGAITLLNPDLFTSFDPDQYVLTMPDGRRLQLSRQFGLQSVTDMNGVSLTISSSGIVSSLGKSVTFKRDAQNRIQTITDPNGNILRYAYDGNGDLNSFTDASNATTTYTYDSNHDLLTIEDPRHVQPIRNDYDANGRLVSHMDAYGNVINYTNDPNTNQETVTDRLGNTTVNEYDGAGNIVKVTDALGGISQRTYDSNGNVLTEINALGYKTISTYDANNNKLSQTDPLGNKTSYTYNAQNQVLTITDANQHVTTNVYDAKGNLSSTTDGANQTTSYTYNVAGQIMSSTDPLGYVTSYVYSGYWNVAQKTDALGHATTYTYDLNNNKISETTTRTIGSTQETLTTGYLYDASNRLIQTTYPDGTTTQIQYDNIGKQATTIDQLNRQTTYEYDLMGRLTKTTYPDTTTETSTYDAEGDRISSTDRAQRTTTFFYDPLKRLTKTVYPDQATAQTGYDAVGEVTTVTDALGNVTRYTYDAAGHRTQVTDALMHATSFTYDAGGNQTSMTDANNYKTQYAYDALNRRTKVIYPDNTTDATAYDAVGRTVSKTDQANLTTHYQYDALGRLIQVTDALSQATTYAYDEAGNRVSQTDANNHTTTFSYDKLNRRVQRTLPAGQTESMTYDVAGNLKSKIDFNGKSTTYNYDLNNRLTAKVPDASFSAPTVTFTYTTAGQRESMTDTSGITHYTYDARDRLTSKITPEGTLTYTYDLSGHLTSIRSLNTNGTSVDYAYDADNRLSTVRDNRLAAGTTTYGYDNAGNLQHYIYPNGVQTNYTYNALNRLTNVEIVHAGSTLASYAYQLGEAGNRTQVNDFGGRQMNYSYDNLYRLKSETIANDPAGVNGVIGYQYDPVGNRRQRTSTVGPISPATYTYDGDDRLGSDTYDADGNTTISGGKTYAYDLENHLVSLNKGQVSIVYDGDGNRVSESVGDITTQYLIDDRNLTGYAQVLEELSGNVVQRIYTYGLNRISQSQASGTTTFYGYDGHDSVRFLTDTTGAVTDRYDYDAFGNLLSQTGTTPNVYLYSSEQNDPNLGFYYLRARYLNAGSGRFVTQDPANPRFVDPPSLHRYIYTRNNPVNLVDPAGAEETLISLAASNAIISVLAQSAIISYKQGIDSLFTPKNELQLFISALSGAVGGVAGGVANTAIANYYGAQFLRTFAAGAVTGAASGLASEITSEFLSFAIFKEPVSLTDANGRVWIAYFGGFALGGLAIQLSPTFSTYEVRNVLLPPRLVISEALTSSGIATGFAQFSDFLQELFTTAISDELFP